MPSEPRRPPTPLQKSIKKYQTAQLKRVEEEGKRATQSVPVAPPAPIKLAPQPQPTIKVQTGKLGKRTTQAVEVVAEWVGWSRRQWAIIASAALLIGLICLGVGAVAVGQAAQVTPTYAPLPMVNAGDILKRLQTLGVNIVNVQVVAVPSKQWSAKHAAQFDVKQGDQLGTFLVMSYDSATQPSIDAFKASVDAKYKVWHVMQTSNVLILSSPNTSAALDQIMHSHVTQYLVAPYRDFLSTATPTKS